MSNLYILHHGIKGQEWGKRNGPPYPLDYEKHSAAEKRENSKSRINGKIGTKSQNHKGLNDTQKKVLKVGAVAAGVGLGGIAAYKLGAVDALSNLGKSTVSNLPEGIMTFKVETFESERIKIDKTDLGGVTNPGNYKNNCKDVSEATLKRWLGVDSGAVAGEKTVTGNLHDFVEKRGYNKSGIFWLGDTGEIKPDPSGDSTDRVTRQILRKYKDGDCGMIGVTWKRELLLPGMDEGHAFNWFIANNNVIFYDGQPDPPVTDASKYLSKIAFTPDENGKLPSIEVVKITKDAFAK